MDSSDFALLPYAAARTSTSQQAARTAQSDAYQDLIDAGWTIQDQDENLGLEMQDFLQLIVQQFQNQTIDQTASATDMLNQLVQMSVVQVLTQVNSSIATMVDASTLTYAASLVGKDVTIGQYDDQGNLQEIYGTVTGTGTYQGAPVIFVGGQQYYLNEILAIGQLPEKPEDGEGGTDAGTDSGTGGTPGIEQI